MVRCTRHVGLMSFMLACQAKPISLDPRPLPSDAAVFADQVGSPMPLMDSSFMARYNRGRDEMARPFGTDEGLGPFFNTESCARCHQFPVPGGSAPRYRDFFLVRTQRADGVLVDAGTNQISPIVNLYCTPKDGYHVAEPHDVAARARRNAPSGLGIGAFQFISSAAILAHEDVDDVDGDGISGKANYETARIGKYGYKLQAHDIESFNRGAALNQMGITTNPLFYLFPESPSEEHVYNQEHGFAWSVMDWLVKTAVAQVAAPAEPTVDLDASPDPELSNEAQLALLIYSTYLAAPSVGPWSADADAGASHFQDVGCTDCHVPRLESTVGPIRAYTDLLLHDMGPEMADDITMAFASESEFRTGPLWGIALHAPYLHDGRAQTLAQAIEAHGGEAAASRTAWRALSHDEQAELLAFLDALGGWQPQGQIMVQPGETAPAVGEPGGPDIVLSTREMSRWLTGRAFFDVTRKSTDGLGPEFNADACRSCHRNPILGAAGGFDTNVIRFGRWDGDVFTVLDDRHVAPRQAIVGQVPYRMSDRTNVVELRQAPSLLGLGLLNRIPDAVILENEDRDDADEDGISGVARRLEDGTLGRFGWKAQIPTIRDFVFDALFHENGLTTPANASTFSISTDQDGVEDPEISLDQIDAIRFYLEHLAAPAPRNGPQGSARGTKLFEGFGCASCHLPSLGGVHAYTDLLLHEIVADKHSVVDQEEGVEPVAYRTAPLWGIATTAPYLHDGRAPTLAAAILAHAREGQGAADAYAQATVEDQQALIDYLSLL